MFRFSSIWAPQRMLASELILPDRNSTAASASWSVMSGPPMTFTSALSALETSTSSSGDWRASSTASTARFSENDSLVDSPMPMTAVPPFVRTVLKSAKSRLTRPGLVTISVTPFKAFASSSSDTRNAEFSGRSGTRLKSLSFGITITVSAVFLSLACDSVAFCQRILPSTVKGNVTTATVTAPASLATSATTGAAPEPVPPPRPHVTKTRSAPCKAEAISSTLSFAEFSPTLGSEPAPSPPVSSAPSRTFLSATEYRRSCASVFIVIVSEPSTPISDKRVIVLQPAPPTPTTLIEVLKLSMSFINCWSTSLSSLLSKREAFSLALFIIFLILYRI